MPFDYEKVMEIADRLLELGIPEKTIKKIRAWAKKKKRKKEANHDIKSVA